MQFMINMKGIPGTCSVSSIGCVGIIVGYTIYDRFMGEWLRNQAF